MTRQPHPPTTSPADAAPTPVPPYVPYQRPSPETWAAARADYEAGVSAPVVAERYGLGERWVRERARTEGWRRSSPACGGGGPRSGGGGWPARGAGVGLDDLRARLQLMVAAPEEDLLARRDADEKLDEIVNDHALEIGRLLMRPTPLDLSRFAFRRAAEAAARGASNEATGWVRLVNAIDRSRPTLERSALPGNAADFERAALARMIRHLQDSEPPSYDAATDGVQNEAVEAAGRGEWYCEQFDEPDKSAESAESAA